MSEYANNNRLPVLHTLPASLPLESGSTIRSKFIVEMQKSFAAPTVAVYPTHSEKQARLGNPAEINGVNYHYLVDRSAVRKQLYDFRLTRPATTRWQMRRFRTFLADVAAKAQPAVIHAATPYTVGLPALQVARSYKIPFVYEVRNLSEFDVLTGRRFDTHGLRVLHRRRSENHLLLSADAVVAISQTSRGELLSRGVDEKKLFTVLNGIDSTVFAPRARDHELSLALGLEGKFVLGSIGYLKRIEGLELLLQAVPGLREAGKDIAVLIVGEGPEQPILKRLASRMGIESQVIFAGQVSFSEILQYYSLIDLFVMPRIRTRLTEIISPLKPLEAMAMQIPVLGSDVGGITEIIRDRENGFTFKAGNLHDLIRQCLFVMENTPKSLEAARSGRQEVLKSRQWSSLVRQYESIYASVSGCTENAEPRRAAGVLNLPTGGSVERA